MIKEVLQETQPVFYQTLLSAFSQDKIPHAFLLTSQKGVDIHEIALFIAKCLICDQEVLACEACNDCRRIEEMNYIDLKYYNGKDESIKKRHIEQIQEEFSKSSVEGKAKIYILENIDNATPEAMNTLLKTLEEPVPGIYAILTCENMNRVLPTIISRCMVVHFRALSMKGLIDAVVAKGVKQEDANLLASIYDGAGKIIETANSELYQELKVEALNFIEDYFLKHDNLIINAQTHIFKNHKEKDEINLFLDLVMMGLRDVLYQSYGLTILYCDHAKQFKLYHQDPERLIQAIEQILYAKEQIRRNANVLLLMDSMMYHL